MSAGAAPPKGVPPIGCSCTYVPLWLSKAVCAPVPGDQIDSELTCSVCLGWLTEPVVLGCGNEHMLCKGCVPGLVDPPRCPIDRGVIGNTLKPAQHVLRMLKRLNAQCPAREAGCPWRGTRGNGPDHVKVCEYVAKTCSVCGEHVLRTSEHVHCMHCDRTEDHRHCHDPRCESGAAGGEWIGPASALGDVHVHCDSESCSWVGSAAELRQHQVCCRKVASLTEEHRDLSARIATVVDRLTQEICDLAARLVRAEEKHDFLAERLVAVEGRDTWLSQDNRDLVLRLPAALSTLLQQNSDLAARLATLDDRLSQEKSALAARLLLVEERNDRLAQEHRDRARCLTSAEEHKRELCGMPLTAPDLAKDVSTPCSTPGEQQGQAIQVALSRAPVQETLPVGLLFPDGNSAHVGMMSRVKDVLPVKRMLEKAGPILGFDVLRLCLEGPEDQLRANRSALMYIASLAGLEKPRTERDETVLRAQAVSGFGSGQFAALAAAGVFSFEDGLRLVKLRSEAIGEASRAPKQAQLWVVGLEKPGVDSLSDLAAKEEGRGAVCQVSSEIFPCSYVVGGTEKSIWALKDSAEKDGASLTQVRPQAAVNTSLMEPVRQRVSEVLDELLPNMNPPRTTVYMNTTAGPMRPGTNPKEIVEVLKSELTSCHLWEASVRAMIKDGVSEFYQVGPGHEIKDYMKRINTKAWRTMTSLEI